MGVDSNFYRKDRIEITVAVDSGVAI